MSSERQHRHQQTTSDHEPLEPHVENGKHFPRRARRRWVKLSSPITTAQLAGGFMGVVNVMDLLGVSKVNPKIGRLQKKICDGLERVPGKEASQLFFNPRLPSTCG